MVYKRLIPLAVALVLALVIIVTIVTLATKHWDIAVLFALPVALLVAHPVPPPQRYKEGID